MMKFQVPVAALPLLVDTFEREEAEFTDALRIVSELDRPGVTRMLSNAASIVAQLRNGGSVELTGGDSTSGMLAHFRASISVDNGSAISRAWDADSWVDLRSLADVMIALDQAA